jgi:hypothetical protein
VLLSFSSYLKREVKGERQRRQQPKPAGDVRGVSPLVSLEKAPSFTCHGRIPEIMRRWASDKGRDSVAATDMNQSLIAWSLPPDRALVLPSPSAHVVD